MLRQGGMRGGWGAMPMSAPRSNRLSCPATLLLRWEMAASSSVSYTAIIWLRRAPVKSKAPALMRLSTTRLFTASVSMRRQKSKMSLKGAFCRWATMASTAPAPTFFTAPRPKRMPRRPSGRRSTVNFHWEAFTLGGRMGMFRPRQYWM